MTPVSNCPTISVVMAVHNGQPYLKEAVESILAQTFRDFEFIIVDDGSIDGSGEYLDQVAQSDSRLRVFHQSNQGLTKSLNVGLQRASGRFVARMDGDDIALLNRFAVQVEYLDANAGVVMVGSEVLLITEDGIPLGPRRHPRDHAQIRRQLLLGNGGSLTHPAVMIRRTALEAVGGYDEDFETAQDLDLFLRLSEVGQVHNLDDTLLHWRQHAQSVNRTRSATWQSMKRLAIRKSLDRCGCEQFVNELFPTEQSFSFPSSAFEQASFALSRGETRGGLQLLMKAVRQNDRRVKSLATAVGVMLRKLVERSLGLTKSAMRGIQMHRIE